MRFSLLPLATIVSPLLGQLKFNGGVSSSSSSNGNSPSSNRARVTPVEEERGKPTLVEARHQEEEEEEGSRRLMWTRGFSCLQGKAAPVIPMGGKEGKLLARMSLAQGSLVDSLVELPTVAT